MSPEPMKVEVNTLVIVMPRGKPPTPPVMCWGLVMEITQGNLFRVRVGKEEHDEIYAFPEQVIPFLHTDGMFTDPQRVYAENESQIMLNLLTRLLAQQGIISDDQTAPTNLPEPGRLIPIQEKTLVIVLPKGGNPPEQCWGIVIKRMIGGNYDVQIGRSRLLFRTPKIIAQPDQLVPVYLTDGSFNDPDEAVQQLRSQLFMHVFLMFRSAEASSFLHQIAEPLLRSSFVLVSRKSKTPPKPGQ